MFSDRLALLVRAARAGVERPLVERDEEDRRVVADDRLRPVAVVDVPVEDRHPAEPELRLGPARGDRDRVEDAEAHRAPRLGVVSRRPREREAAASGRLDRGAGGEQRGLVRRLGADRVAVEPAAARCGRRSTQRRRVAAEHVLLGGGRALGEREPLVEHLDPALRLRMASRRVERARRPGWLTTSIAASAQPCSASRGRARSGRARARLRRGRAPSPARRLVAAPAAAPRRPSGRCGGTAAGRRRPSRSARRRAPPRGVPYCASSAGRRLRPDAGRAGDAVGGVAAQRDEVRRPAPGRRRSARAPRPARSRASSLTPLTGCRIDTRSLTSWNASRSDVATTTGPGQRAAAAARKSSAS